MERSVSSLLILLVGVVLLAVGGALGSLLVDARVLPLVLIIPGGALAAWGLFLLRGEIGSFLHQRRGQIAMQTVGLVGIVVAIAYLSVRFPARIDMTEAHLYSLSPQTVTLLERLDKPVHITFFYDPMMRETVEFYELIASKSDMVTVDFHDPLVNPAQARLSGVEFAGTALMESEGRKITVNTALETDIANGILRVSQGIQQKVCFLEGHGEPDPFSLEQHDHMEGTAGHSHGLGQQFVLHERHGMAKLRHSLETMNYVVEKVSLLKGGKSLDGCAVLVVAGPKTELLPKEVKQIAAYIENGNNALFMLDPFVKTGLEPLIRRLGVVLDDDLVIDEESHFWTDVSSPAVTRYNPHSITRDLPLTFFPGARSLSPTDERVADTYVRPLINSSRQSYGERDPQRAEFNPDEDLPGPRTIMVIVNKDPNYTESAEAVIRKLREDPNDNEPSPPQDQEAEKTVKRSRIAIIGDSDFATNSFFHILGNGNLFLNTINYLTVKENLIGIEPKTLDLPKVNLTNRQMRATFFLSIVLIPALMAVIGFAVWWRQR
jgi:ABC-type uncharacterized transport system involved in gliding motility auxiliary subunit